MSAIGAAAVTAGAAALSSGTNAIVQGKLNKKTRDWNEKMFDRQTATNERQWQMQNEYNSPTSQMARLREAGLNENLVYGNGANAQGGSISSSSPQSWKPEAPRVDFGESFSRYQNIRLGKAQEDNLKAQNTVLLQDAALKAATTAGTIQKTARDVFDLDLASELRQVSADSAREALRKQQADISYTLAENERAAASNASNLQEAAQRILNMREQNANSVEDRKRIKAQIGDIHSSQKLKDLDIELKKNGINPSDPMFMRILGRILGGFEVDVKDAFRRAPEDRRSNLGRAWDAAKGVGKWIMK